MLLNDDVLVGSGVTCQETLRPLAHSVLIDLLHNVRIQLTLPQISRIILAYSRNLQDISIPPQIQTMCVKLLLGLADNLVNQPSKHEGLGGVDNSAVAFDTDLGFFCCPIDGHAGYVADGVDLSQQEKGDGFEGRRGYL